MKFGTKTIHSCSREDLKQNSLMPPIYMTSTYLQDYPGAETEFSYTRSKNPNFVLLEELLASLEDAKYCTVFSSGLGALTALVSTLSQGDKVLGFNGVYGGTYRLFNDVFSKFGVEYISIPSSSPLHLERGFATNPKWLFFETPTNPLIDIYDIEAMCKAAKKRGILSIVDNTFATPYLQHPLKLGADVIIHSSTKYLGGHSDVIGGAIVTNNSLVKRQMDFSRKALGINPSPFDCWLITRGIKTLALRMKQHEINAKAIAEYFSKHPLVKQVFYPGLPSHPGHTIAKKQMRGFGGMLAVEFNLPIDTVKEMVSSYKIFKLAESLGGVESLVSHPATMTHASIPPIEREKCGISDRLVRYSVGIEETEDLIEDLAQGLNIQLTTSLQKESL